MKKLPYWISSGLISLFLFSVIFLIAKFESRGPLEYGDVPSATQDYSARLVFRLLQPTYVVVPDENIRLYDPLRLMLFVVYAFIVGSLFGLVYKKLRRLVEIPS